MVDVEIPLWLRELCQQECDHAGGPEFKTFLSEMVADGFEYFDNHSAYTNREELTADFCLGQERIRIWREQGVSIIGVDLPDRREELLIRATAKEYNINPTEFVTACLVKGLARLAHEVSS